MYIQHTNLRVCLKIDTVPQCYCKPNRIYQNGVQKQILECFIDIHFMQDFPIHNIDVAVGATASQITSVCIVCSTVCPGAD